MGRFGGFYKGEKKKPKKKEQKISSTFAPSEFRMPEIIGRKQKSDQ